MARRARVRRGRRLHLGDLGRVSCGELLRHRRIAADDGVLFPDHFDHDWRAGSRERVYDAIRSLQPGVTEIHVQPAIDTPEVRAITPAAPLWIDDHALVTSDPKVHDLIAEVGAVLIGYRELREVMRANLPSA